MDGSDAACPICFDPIMADGAGSAEAFSWCCEREAGACATHHFHLGCAVQSIYRLQGCPLCNEPGAFEEDGSVSFYRRARIAEPTMRRLEDRRSHHGLPRPAAAPVQFGDWDTEDMRARAGYPERPWELSAVCMNAACVDSVSRPYWAPLASGHGPSIEWTDSGTK